MPYASVDLSHIKTYPLVRRENRVALDDLIDPASPIPPFDNAELGEVAERIAEAREAGRPVIMMFGGHLIKRGLAPLVNALLKNGVVTHLASNGAATIHDFEIALLGHTSEDVAKSLADGSFGMAEETGALMNAAIRRGAADGLGMGEALGRLVDEDPGFPFREHSVLYTAHRLGIPYTVHVALGTDIIHQHPAVDFAALGWATGQDFKIFARAVCDLEGGVFLNVGSAVIGPEVFLKALSIARNLGNPLRVFTTANFDLIPLRDYRQPVEDSHPDYYYRPRKNVVNRPVMLGGRGYHINGDHLATLPNLYRQVLSRLTPRPPQSQTSAANTTSGAGTETARASAAAVEAFALRAPAAAAVLAETLAVDPELAHNREDLMRSYRIIECCLRTSGTLFLAGSSASLAAVLQAPGARQDSAAQPRIPHQQAHRLAALPGGPALAEQLRPGLRIIVLGENGLPASPAVGDPGQPGLGFAQALYSLARPGDVLLGFEAGTKCLELQPAARVAQLLGLASIFLGRKPGGSRTDPPDLPGPSNLVIAPPTVDPARSLAWQARLYHCLYQMLAAQILTEEERA